MCAGCVGSNGDWRYRCGKPGGGDDETPDLSKYETKTGAQAKANAAGQKALADAKKYTDDKLKDAGGDGGETWETPEGAQAKVDEHAKKTTDVHGIPDTSKLVTEDEIGPIVDAAVADAVDKLPPGTGGDTWETPEGAQAKVDEHAEKTADVHGIKDTSQLVTKPEMDKAISDAVKDGGGDGTQGPPGPAGPEGPEGPAGHTPQTTSGDTAPTEPAKEDGDLYLDNSTGDLYTQTDGKWIKLGSIKGPKGDPGSGDGDPAPGGLTEEEAQKLIDKAMEDALSKHIVNCHTLEIETKGVTVEDGWEIDVSELRTLGGVSSGFLRLKRTGEDILSKGPDFMSEGKPNQGNVVPDLKIAKLTGAWVPPQSQVVGAGTSYGSGTIRIEKTGDVYLLDWTYNNPLRTNHLLRVSFDFIVESKCQNDGKEPAPEPAPKPDPGDGAATPGGSSGTGSGVRPMASPTEIRSVKVDIPSRKK